MQLYALTAAGFALMDFGLVPDPAAVAVPPTVIEVDHHHVTITEVPIALSDVAAAVGSPLWIHGGRLHTLPPIGPVGTDLGHPTGLKCTLSSDAVTVHRPVVFDFSAPAHQFPNGVEATVALFRGTDPVWAADLTPSESGVPGTVTLSATALGAYLTVGADGATRIILPHPTGSLYDAAAIMSTLLLGIYLALVAGTRHDTDIDADSSKWLLLIVDGPLAALGAIVGAAETFETSTAWRYLRYASFVGICGAGATIVVVLRFLQAERGPIEEWERRLIEPAIVVALQVPFVGRLGSAPALPPPPPADAARRHSGADDGGTRLLGHCHPRVAHYKRHVNQGNSRDALPTRSDPMAESDAPEPLGAACQFPCPYVPHTRPTAGGGCDGDAAPTVDDGSRDGHLSGDGDDCLERVDETMTHPGPPDAWSDVASGDEAPEEPEAAAEDAGSEAAVDSSTLVRLDADCPDFSSGEDAAADIYGAARPEDMDGFLARFAENPKAFGAAELDHFLRAFDAQAPEAAVASVDRFVETTAEEAHGVAVELWERWKSPEVPPAGSAPANFLQAFKELFPNSIG